MRVVHNNRFNQQGRDVNRDFALSKSQEAEIVKNHVAGKRYDLMVDLHEDPRAKGFYTYQYANRGMKTSLALTD